MERVQTKCFSNTQTAVKVAERTTWRHAEPSQEDFQSHEWILQDGGKTTTPDGTTGMQFEGKDGFPVHEHRHRRPATDMMACEALAGRN